MSKSFFLLVVLMATGPRVMPRYSISLGIYSGVTGSYTADKGIENDPRYDERFEAKLAPIGVNIGLDYEAFGLLLSPGIINLGQNFYVINTQGGQDGMRTIDLKYFLYLYRSRCT